MRREFEFKVEHNKWRDGNQVHEICNRAKESFRTPQENAEFTRIIGNAELGSDLRVDEKAKHQEEHSSNFPYSEAKWRWL